MGTLITENSPRQARTHIITNNSNFRHLLVSSLFVVMFSLSISAQKTYQKIYFDNGAIKEAGWLNKNEKTDYWKYYHSNGKIKKEGHYNNGQPSKYWYFYHQDGTKKSEGHYRNGLKNNWWLFYDDMEIINHKCQLKNNQKNGYYLMYKNKKLISARKYRAGKQIKEWTDLKSFKKENNLRDLK